MKRESMCGKSVESRKIEEGVLRRDMWMDAGEEWGGEVVDERGGYGGE